MWKPKSFLVYAVVNTMVKRKNLLYVAVTLKGTETESFPQKFIKFMIVAENKDTEDGEIGTFEIEDSFTKFSHKCPNAVAEASKIPREAVTVAWISPHDGVGCISIR